MSPEQQEQEVVYKYDKALNDLRYAVIKHFDNEANDYIHRLHVGYVQAMQYELRHIYPERREQFFARMNASINLIDNLTSLYTSISDRKNHPRNNPEFNNSEDENVKSARENYDRVMRESFTKLIDLGHQSLAADLYNEKNKISDENTQQIELVSKSVKNLTHFVKDKTPENLKLVMDDANHLREEGAKLCQTAKTNAASRSKLSLGRKLLNAAAVLTALCGIGMIIAGIVLTGGALVIPLIVAGSLMAVTAPPLIEIAGETSFQKDERIQMEELGKKMQSTGEEINSTGKLLTHLANAPKPPVDELAFSESIKATLAQGEKALTQVLEAKEQKVGDEANLDNSNNASMRP